MTRAASFFSAVAARKQPMKARRDAGPLAPAELIAVRKMIRKPVVEVCLSSVQVGKRLGFPSRTVLEWVKRGEFPKAFKPARNAVRIPESDVLAWQERHRVDPVATAGADARTGPASFFPEAQT